MERKYTYNDLPIQKGKIDVEFIQVDNKKIILTPINYSNIERYITHKECEVCHREYEKQSTYSKLCPECRLKKDQEYYSSLKLVEWDGNSALYLYDSTDIYFFDKSEVEDYCEDESIDISDLQLLLCEKTSFSPIQLETITQEGELVHEDWEPSQEFEDKLNEFNNWLVKQSTSTWIPTDKRVKLL